MHCTRQTLNKWHVEGDADGNEDDAVCAPFDFVHFPRDAGWSKKGEPPAPHKCLMLSRGLDGSYCPNRGPADRPAPSQGSSCHQLAQMDTARGTAAETWPETCTSGRPARGDTLPKSRQQTDLKAHDLLGFRHSYGHTRTQMPPASPASRRARACAPLWAHQLNAAGQSSSHHSPAESQEGGAAGGRGGETSKTSGQSRHREA